MERVCGEILHLAEEVTSALAADGFDIAVHDDDCVAEEQMSGLRYGFSYSIKRAYKGQRREAQLMLQWDLWRPDEPSVWPYRNSALMLVAYDAELSDGWDADQLSVRSDGQLADDRVRAMIATRCDGRLLLWERRAGDPHFARQAWMYGLHLGEIQDLADARRMILEPVRTLLKKPEDALQVLQRANSIVWPARQP